MKTKRRYDVFEDSTIVKQVELKTTATKGKKIRTFVPVESSPSPATIPSSQPPSHAKESISWEDWIQVGSSNDIDTTSSNDPRLESELPGQESQSKFTTGFYLSYWKENRCKMHIQRLLDMEQNASQACVTLGCAGQAIYKCHGCLGNPVFCQACCVSSHTRLPFHRITKWNGSFFQPAWLIDIGLVVQMGHGGSHCPSIPPAMLRNRSTLHPVHKAAKQAEEENGFYYSNTRGATHQVEKGESVLTIVDISAVHQVCVRWCKCHDATTMDLQLFDLGLFPFTFQEPQSAITFRALDEVRLTNLECNTPVSRWYTKIMRSTNPAFPFTVKDRHKEVARTERIWRYISQMIMHGFGHTDNEPEEGELVDFCVACPQPGFNLPPDWQNDPEQWKYCRSVIVDGNFSADHVKLSVSNDIALSNGTGYMARTTEFKKHMETARVHKQNPTCHEHKAATHTSSSKKHLDITGVSGGACTRHGCWVPGSVTDFSKGEAQPPVDYTVDRALKYRSGGLKKFALSYDINCQYSVHHEWRVEHSPFLSFPLSMETLDYLIGLFHVHGHMDDCEYRFSPTFMPGAGRISGEIIETLWEPLNPIASSTRVSSLSLRREVIDDHMADSNFKKEYRIVDATISKFHKSIIDVQDAVDAFNNLSSNLTTEQIATYTRAEAEAQHKRSKDVKALDIYAVQMEKAPTAAAILSSLIRREMEQPQCSFKGAASWISDGIELESEILALKARVVSMSRFPTEKQVADLTQKRQRLQCRIDAFNQGAQQYLTKNIVEIPRQEGNTQPTGLWRTEEETEFRDSDLDEENPSGPAPNQTSSENTDTQPEDAVLFIPSNITWTGSRQFSSDVQRTELELRRGALNNVIQELRVIIADKSVLYRTQVRSAKSQAKKTRAWGNVKRVQQELDHYRRLYNHSRRAIVNLGASTDDLEIYRELSPTHLRASTAIIQPNAPGQRDVALSWIWSSRAGRATNSSEWLEEVYRVGWLRAKARRDRASEELQLLRHEMDWIINAFRSKEDRWHMLANQAIEQSQPGHACFAKCQESLSRAHRLRAQNIFGKYRASIAYTS